MISRNVICEFLGLYPWNSEEIQLDLDDDIVKAASEKVATELIFDEMGRRFYDYLRGRHDATVREPTEDNRMPDPDKDPEAVTEWIKSEFTPKDLMQFFFVVSLPGITAQLIYDDLSGENPEVPQDILEASVELLTSNTEFSKKIQEEFYKLPDSEIILEKYVK